MSKTSEGGVGGIFSLHFLRTTKHCTPLLGSALKCIVLHWWLVDVFRLTTAIEWPAC